MYSTVFLIGYGVLSIIAAGFASDKRIGFFPGFIVAILFTPPIAMLCAFISGDKESNKMWTCNHCGFQTKSPERFCPGCDKDITNGKTKEEYMSKTNS